MAIFSSPSAFRFNLERRYLSISDVPQAVTAAAGHTSHPSFAHLLVLVFEAVLEVVCVSLPGYIAARSGMFDADAQKLVANLNVALFTPCLGQSPALIRP